MATMPTQNAALLPRTSTPGCRHPGC